MTPLHTLSARLPRGLHWLPPQRGYIGIDIGSRAMKLAQVERCGDRWDIAAKWLLPLPEMTAAPDVAWLRGAFDAVKDELIDLRAIFAGRQVAIALPMCLNTLRCLEMPSGSDEEVRAMVYDELSDDFAGDADFTFDMWDMSPRPSGGNGTLHLTAFSTRNELSTCAAEGLLAAGYECHVLDAVPCALARCTQLAAPQMADQPAIALDLGYYSPQIIVCRNGRPSFCRALPDCGLKSLMQPLRERLKLSEAECQQLLSQLGISSFTGGAQSSAASRAVTQILAPKLAHLANEVERTLTYIRQQFRDQFPQQMWLFGGGAGLGNLAELLSHRVGIPVRTWSPAPETQVGASPVDAQFAAAAALSLLSWEGQRCT